MGKKTTRDEINLDLDGTIDAAIKKLQKLKKDYPKGCIHLTSDYEYGESYPRLKLEFTRPKEPVEIELSEWQDKRRRLDDMARARAAYEREGDTYPRSAEIEALAAELGCFADPMSSLVIYGDEILAWGFYGAQRRDGTWVMKTMMDFPPPPPPAQGIEAGTAETEGLDPKGESPVGNADAPNPQQPSAG